MSEWEIESTWNAEIHQAYSSVAGESLVFFDQTIWDQFVERVGTDNFRTIWNDGRLIGGLGLYRMAQWYGGQAVDCAGVTGVAIEPAFRGAGTCRHLLEHCLRELYDQSVPLACLYASTERLYRRVGFEHSGHRIEYSLAMEAFAGASRDASYPVRRDVAPDYETMAQISRRRSQLSAGALQRTRGLWERICHPVGGQTTSTYFLGGDSAPDGFVTLVHGDRRNGYPQPLVATDWVANTASAMHRLKALVHGHRSMCDRFQWTGGPQDQLLFHCDCESLQVLSQLHTLSRLVDVQAAFEARGYPGDASGTLQLDVVDPLLSGNAGRWVLTVADGNASLERGGAGLIKGNVQALAPLFTGLHSCSQLIQLGVLSCDDGNQIALADQVFAGPAPWTTEIF